MRVADLMTRQVMSCRPHDTLERAAQLLWDHDCGVLPVIDEDGTVVGMLTDRDALMCAYTQGRALRDLRVSRAMAAAVETCRPDTPLSEALEQLRARRIHRLPVVDEQARLVGLLSLDDVAYASTEYRAHGPSAQSVAEAVAEIAGHRGPRHLAERRTLPPRLRVRSSLSPAGS